MKKILMFLCLVVYFLPGCKKEDEKTGQKDRFEIVDSKSIVRGNLILGQALNDSNLLVIAFKNAPSNTSATITADTVNGMYIEPTTINLEGSSTVSIKMKGTPITDGTFVLMIKMKINGVTYISSKEFYVDLPNYTSINLTLSDSAFYNIVDSAKIAFQVDPKSTDFTIVAPAHIKAEIQSVSANERILKVTADSAFVMGDVLITGTFRNVPPIVKTIHLYAFAGGKGSSAAPFEIPDVKRLQKIQYALDKAYKLTADITQPASLVSNSVFTGILDGSGHTISNVSINAPATNNTGYFQEIGVGGVVKNLTFKNTAITGQDFVGVVAGINRGTITNLTITGTLKGRTYIGGIAGNNFGTVTSCNVMGLTISGANNIGSLAGSVNASSSETDNSVLIIPASFQTEVFGIAGPQTITFGFLPSDGTIAVKTVPANLTATAVAGQQTVSLTPQPGFISGVLQLSLEKDNLSALRNITIYSKQKGDLFDAGDGSVASPYIISTEEAFNAMLTNPSKNYQLAADISLSKIWVTIPNFSGSLDGKGYSVNGLVINSTSAYDGFINTNTGTIKNIQFLNVACSANNSFGVISGKNSGGTIQNVIVSGSVTSTSSSDVLGGIAGELDNGGKLTQCYVKLAITAPCGMVGGIAGRLTTTAGKTAEISFCTSAGSINITAAKNRIGGILGRAEGGLLAGGIIKNCVSSMDISSTGATAGSANGMGGIFGADQNAGIVPIDQCMFTGSVVTGFSLGGIAGVGSSITNCIVAGQPGTPLLLSSIGASPATGLAGGIAGTNKTKLINCVVKNVAIKASVSPSTLPMGGVVSTYQNNGYSTGCLVANTSLEGSNTVPNSNNVYRIAGTAGSAPGNSKNYVGSGVTAQYRTANVPFVEDPNGLDGSFNSTITQSFLQGIGFDFSIWKIDADGYPTLKNAGYNGGLPIPQ